MNNGVGYARPAARPNDVVLGTDGIGADMLEEFRLAYVAHRADDVTAPGHGVVVAEQRLPLRPGGRARPGTWTYDHADSPWHVAFTPGMRVARRRHRRWRGARRRRRPTRSTSPRSAPTPPSRPARLFARL